MDCSEVCVCLALDFSGLGFSIWLFFRITFQIFDFTKSAVSLGWVGGVIAVVVMSRCIVVV